MFNQLQEEEIESIKHRQENLYLKESNRFSEREEINFSLGSSRRQKPSSQSNFSRDLNSHASESFLFLKARGGSQEEIEKGENERIKPKEPIGIDFKIKSKIKQDSNIGLYPSAVLNKLDVNSLSKSQNNIKHKLSDMFSSGDFYRGRVSDQGIKGSKKNTQVLLGKREDNATSIFPNVNKEKQERRHLDFVSKGGQDLLLQNSGRLRKTELTRMMSLLGDHPLKQNCRNSHYTSVQKNKVEEDLASDWIKISDDKSRIRSFGRVWSGLESQGHNIDEFKNIAPESMMNFEKESEFKIKKNLCSNQFSDGSKNSLVSERESSFNDLGKGNQERGQKYALSKARKLYTSKINLNDLKCEETGFMRNIIRDHIPEAEEEFESSRPSKYPKGSEGESMYISELNDNNSKDRLLLKVLMENPGKKVNINTINTNYNTVNNNNNNLNYISNPKNISQIFSDNEMQFVKYLNDIKNYFVDPNSKAIFLKIGVDETKEEKNSKEPSNLNPENKNTQLIPLTNFIQKNDSTHNCSESNTQNLNGKF